jgi:hypothetical protein
MLAERRLPEDICNDWSGEEEYRLPLRDFFAPKLVEA